MCTTKQSAPESFRVNVSRAELFRRRNSSEKSVMGSASWGTSWTACLAERNAPFRSPQEDRRLQPERYHSAQLTPTCLLLSRLPLARVTSGGKEHTRNNRATSTPDACGLIATFFSMNG